MSLVFHRIVNQAPEICSGSVDVLGNSRQQQLIVIILKLPLSRKLVGYGTNPQVLEANYSQKTT